MQGPSIHTPVGGAFKVGTWGCVHSSHTFFFLFPIKHRLLLFYFGCESSKDNSSEMKLCLLVYSAGVSRSVVYDSL